MSALLIRLRPTTPWRIGSDSGDRDLVGRIYHSDALFGAVCSAMSALGHLEDWLSATVKAAQSAVRFSSCFPFHDRTLYVVPPRHVWPPPPSAKVRWKGARFVPMSVVEALLSGETLHEDAWAIDAASECLQPAAIASATSAVFRASVRTAAGMDREGLAAVAHSTGCLEFTPDSGLWFAVEFASGDAQQEWQGPVQAALRLLADSGFGGERSRGWGRSEMPEILEGPLQKLLFRRETPALDGPSGHWLLSLFHPADDDSVDWQQGNYSVLTRGGRVESSAGWGESKRDSRMVAEGSILVAAKLSGRAVDVAPQGFAHPVYRAGFALSLPVPTVISPKAAGKVEG